MQVVLAPTAPYKLDILNRVGLLIVLFGVIGGLLWSSFVSLDSAVVAIGKVKVHSEKKEIQHFEGGIVKSIKVKEGERVKAGQLLLTLDDTFAHSDLDRLTVQWSELKIREAVSNAKIDRLSNPIFQKAVIESEDSEWIKGQVESALNGFRISESNLKSQLNILENQAEQISEQIAGIELEVQAKKEQIEYTVEEIASWKSLIVKQMANKLRYLELQAKESELKGEVAQLNSQVSSLKVKLSEIKYNSLVVQQEYREKASNELADIKLNLKDITKRMSSATNVLERIEITSPVDGIVVGLSVHTIGAVIKPAETILEIIPEKDELIIEAKVKPIDVDKVFESLESRIKISSFKIDEFPEFQGVVASISADSFENPDTLEEYYIARIAIPEDALNERQIAKIKPGMPTEVLIVTGESTPLQYLIDPLLSAFRTAWRD